MNRKILSLTTTKVRKRTERRNSGISPIIATLLLILIAIAAGVIVYAYVIGFVGTTSSGQPVGTSSLSIATASGSHTGSLTAYVQNIGSNTATISAIYVLDGSGATVAGGVFIGSVAASSANSCATITNSSGMDCTLSAGSTAEISISSGVSLTAGNTYQLKVTTADGSTILYTFKAS